jgi:two-component system, response regulator FlrC
MSSSKNILLVSEDQTLRSELRAILVVAGYQVTESELQQEALATIASKQVKLVICDVEFSGMESMLLLAETRSRKNQMPFVLITTYASVPKAVTAIQAGAADYLTIPFSSELLLETVERLITQSITTHDFIINDPRSKQLAELANRVAQSTATVMITGESGTGKEVFAKYIHESSPRCHKPFVAINCAAIPETMLESLLFGYEKGAFTGAVVSKPGKFEQANGGTLLLDEISEMDLALQAKLLRVIQEKEVERLGSSRPVKLDVRLIATSNRDLKAEVKAGRFREDLFYRLNVFPLALPGLRQRPGDIVPLAQLFLQRYQGSRQLELSEEAKTLLKQHKWPGNIRELENAMQRALILCDSNLITANDLVFESQEIEELDTAELFIAPNTAATGLETDLKSLEKELIFGAITQHSRKDAAEMLGISPRTLRYKIAQFRKAGLAIPA